MGRVEGEQGKVAPPDEDDRKDQGTQDDHLPHVIHRDAQEVAKQDVGEVHLARNLGDEHGAQGEQSREHDAHGGVGAYDAIFPHRTNEDDGQKCRNERTDNVGKSQQIRDNDPRKHRVRDGITHERPTHVDHIAADDATDQGRSQARDQGTLHEGVREEVEESRRRHQATIP